MNGLSTKRLSWISCSKETTMLALPILGAHVIEALIPFINTAMAASLGEISLAAAGLVGSAFFALMGFCWGVVASVGIITANKIGEAKQIDKIGLILWAGFITSFILSIPLMLTFKHMHSFWIYWGQDANVVQSAQEYMNGLSLAVAADLAKFAIFQYAIACDKPRVPLVANIISIPLLIFFNKMFMQKFGIYGIGLGTALTYWIVFAIMLIYLLTNKHFKSYLLQTHETSNYLKTCVEQLKLGIPIGLMFSIELLFFMVFALFMGYISATTLAANQIAMQWMFFTIMLAYGFTEAVTILVAKANGAGEYRQVKYFTFSGILLAVASTFFVVCLYWFLPTMVVSIDLSNVPDDPLLLPLAIKMLMFCGVYQLLDCIRIVISGALRGMNDSKYPMWAAIVSFWAIGLPIGYIFAFSFNWHETGLWIGLIVAALINILLQYYRIQQKTVHSLEQINTALQS